MSWINFFRCCCSLIVGSVLVLAGMAKLRTRGSVAAASRLRRLAGGLLPWVELAAGIGCLANVGWSWPGAFVAAMLAAFTLSLIPSIARGGPVRCGCFGEGAVGEIPAAIFLARNAALIALALMGMRADVTKLTAGEWTAGAFVATVTVLSYLLLSTHLHVRKLAQ